MKTKLFKHGSHKYKSYLKPVGKGYEVGFNFGAKPLFVGNFINQAEAWNWYQLMNREFEKFAKKYWHPTDGKAAKKPVMTFFHRFITNTMYKHYYDYLDKHFVKYTKNFHREYTRDLRQYNKIKKHWAPKDTPYVRRAS